MSRVLLALGLGLLAASAARADGLPPKGSKRVTLDHRFTAEKEFPDYRLFAVVGGQGAKATVTPIKLDPKTPATLPGAGRSAGIGRSGTLVAVPKDAEKNYATEKEFHEAIKLQKVDGLVRARANFDNASTLKDTDKRDTIVHEHKIEKVDKDGITFSTKRDADAPEKKDGDKKEPSDEDAPGVTAYTPRGGLWVAGVAVFAAVTLGGLWVVGRSRRKV